MSSRAPVVDMVIRGRIVLFDGISDRHILIIYHMKRRLLFIWYSEGMKPSIFTKIINGEIPCYKIYEDERTFAFLDINPVQPGHTLVVPRQQVDHFDDLEDEDYEALMHTVKLLAQTMREELQVERICVIIEGFEVPHVHVKLIPCNTAEDFRSEAYEADEDELRDMVERLAY